MLKKFLLPLLVIIFSSTYALADSDKTVDDTLDTLMGKNVHGKYHDFFTKFKKSVLMSDKESISSMIAYPITVSVENKEIDIKNKKDFLKNYNKIFNKELVKTIASQKYSDLFVKDTGVMIGQYKDVWFSGICTVSDCSEFDIKIMQINN